MEWRTDRFVGERIDYLWEGAAGPIRLDDPCCRSGEISARST